MCVSEIEYGFGIELTHYFNYEELLRAAFRLRETYEQWLSLIYINTADTFALQIGKGPVALDLISGNQHWDYFSPTISLVMTHDICFSLREGTLLDIEEFRWLFTRHSVCLIPVLSKTDYQIALQTIRQPFEPHKIDLISRSMLPALYDHVKERMNFFNEPDQ